MGLGILDSNKLTHVPGTVLLDEQAGHSEDQTRNLKHATGKDAHIILAPQPSEDPNDPLNWSQFRKDLALAVLCFGAIINAATQVRAHIALVNHRVRCSLQGWLLSPSTLTRQSRESPRFLDTISLSSVLLGSMAPHLPAR
jgi:hypothetical protein